jgi:rubrerythrin
MEIAEMIGGILLTFLMTLLMPIIIFGGIGLFFYYIIKHAKENKPDIIGERKVIQKDERITLIYRIRKDDPEFVANEIEQYISNYVKRLYPDLIFRSSDFVISDYAKVNDIAQITYSIITTNKEQEKREYQAILQMNIKGSDDMLNYTKECNNCGAVIEDDTATVCPYCGQTYNFQKYNKWKIKEVIVV